VEFPSEIRDQKKRKNSFTLCKKNEEEKSQPYKRVLC
jgi:hypothetical protein